MKLYCVAHSGRMIPGHGSRDYGGAWDDLPAALVEELKDRRGFSLTDPAQAIRTPAKLNKPLAAPAAQEE